MNRGFTLIELLIVIAIIGVLAAVIVPNLLSARARAYDSQARACAKAIAQAQEIYQIDSGSYVVDTASLDAGVLRPCVSANTSVDDSAATASTYSFRVNVRGRVVTVTQDGLQ